MGNTKSTNGFCPRIDRFGITSNLIGTSAVQGKHLKALAVSSAKIASKAITSAKLATSAVTNAKVANATINMGSANSGSTAGKLDGVYKTAVIRTAMTVVTLGISRRPRAFIPLNVRNSTAVMRGTTATTWTTIGYIKLKSSVVTNATTLILAW